MIEVHDLQKSFGKVAALRGVSFTAANGQITGLLGPNGAGKTTLLRILYTILAPDAGEAKIDGYQVTDNPQEVAKLIGALPHAHGLYARLTTREHIRYYAHLHGLRGPHLEKRIDSLIELLDMRDIADRRTKGFSQGECVKVAVARAIIHDPPNILFDEPTAGLDVIATRNIRTFIKQLRDMGRCVLFSSHMMHEVTELCDQVVVIANGQIAAVGSPDELRQKTGCENFEEAFVAIIGSDEGLRQ